MPTSHNAPAGWYPQPDGSQRYWDGYQWTEHFAPQSEPAHATTSFSPGTHDMGTPPNSPDLPDATERPWFKKKRVIIPAIALVFIVAIAALSGGDGAEDMPRASQIPSATSTDAQVDTPEPSEPVTEEVTTDPVEDADDVVAEASQAEAPEPDRTEEPDHTVSQAQAIRSAENYLAYTAFSRKGLIDQLKFEGFSAAEAEYAVDHIAPDWAEQAHRSAEDYLDYAAFSRKGLIQQLEFEGYSADDATYGVDNVTVDWMEQAALKAEEYLAFTSFSRSSLIDQLKFEGFTSEQAAHGADAVGL